MLRKMKNSVIFLVSLLVLMSAITITSFAGQWKQDSVGWWYQNDDGSYLSNGWYWLDGNNDGTAECYYFDDRGYMLANTVTPDGYTVNADGQWVEGAVVQTKVAVVNNAGTTTETIIETTIKADSGMMELTPENFWNYFEIVNTGSIKEGAYGEVNGVFTSNVRFKDDTDKLIDSRYSGRGPERSIYGINVKYDAKLTEYKVQVDWNNKTYEILKPTGKTKEYTNTETSFYRHPEWDDVGIRVSYDRCKPDSDEVTIYLLANKEDLKVKAFSYKIFIKN